MSNDNDNLLSEEDEFGGYDIFDELKRSEESQNSAPEAPEMPLEDTQEPEGDTTPSEPDAAPEEDSSDPDDVLVPGKPKKGPTLKKRARKPLSKRQKTMGVILRRAGVPLPTLDELLRGKQGQSVPISNIAIFLGDSKEPLIEQLTKECPLRNRINMSAEVVKSRIVAIGAQILEAGRMHTPIHVAAIRNQDEDGIHVADSLECVSGRTRLAFLLLAYGPDIEVPVYIESMSLKEARDAVVVANQSRPVKARERAEHAVLKAVGGDTDVEQDDLYKKTVTTKAKARKYCIYSVSERGYPTPLSFPVSLTSSRRDGGITTLTNVENYLGSAMEWTRETPRQQFDNELKVAVEFVNELVDSMRLVDGFEPSQHLSAATMSAIGKYYHVHCRGNGSAAGVASGVASAIVSMGSIGKQEPETTCAALDSLMHS